MSTPSTDSEGLPEFDANQTEFTESDFNEFMEEAMHFCRAHPKILILGKDMDFEHEGTRYFLKAGMHRIPVGLDSDCEHCTPGHRALAELSRGETYEG